MNIPIDLKALEEFRRCIEKAEIILYLGDNSGKILFDKLFIEHLPLEKITDAVRGAPFISDATMQDADQVGMNDLVEVIDNDSDAPGTILSNCSGKFRDKFIPADLIIAKGQGIYETLSDIDSKIFFLLQAKCPVIARDIGYHVGDFFIAKII